MHPVVSATASRVAGLAQAGDIIRWEGIKFGFPQFHESLIDRFDPPVYFRDRMTAGRFRTFHHDHHLIQQPGSAVVLRDEIRFTMRWGILGELVGRSLLVPDIRMLLRRRFALLKQIAETDLWQEYL
jgi:ligand-binding SRPBCC domain-containing protein